MRTLAGTLAICTAMFFAAAVRADEIDYKKLYARIAPGVVLIYGEEGRPARSARGRSSARTGWW